jgi:hypothetical protein
VDGQRGAVSGIGAPCGADPLGDVEDDAGKAVFVEIDFLIIWNLTKSAAIY